MLTTLVLIVLAVAAVTFLVKKATGSTAPNPPMINTGEPWKPGENKEPADNRPKPPTPPFDKNNPV